MFFAFPGLLAFAACFLWLRPSKPWAIAGLFALCNAMSAALVLRGAFGGEGWFVGEALFGISPEATLLHAGAAGFSLAALLAAGLPAFALLRSARVPARAAKLGVAACSCLLAAVGFHNGQALPQERERVADLAWDPALDGVRILVASDLHADRVSGTRRIDALARAAERVRPDLVLLPGDMLDAPPERFAGAFAAVAAAAPGRTFAAEGNHEHYSAPRDRIAASFARAGIPLLVNEARSVEIRGRRVFVAAVADRQGPRVGLSGPDARSALAEVPPGAPAILMEHRPAAGGEVAGRSADLLRISGHTHGGHAPGLDRIIGLFNEGLHSGFERRGASLHFVSPGAGQWFGFSIRLLNDPEFSVLTVRSAGAPRR